ncbi:MAG: glycoside hydrolase family 3 protein [Oscillospiraceae bacterium]|nr:glycoside hydrolase family 3 protein [Oscillospiraceae bacterium]
MKRHQACVLLAGLLLLTACGSGNHHEQIVIPDVPAEEQPTQPDPAGDYERTDPVSRHMIQMSIREKLCQMFIITPEALTGVGQVVAAGEKTQAAYQIVPVGGLIYFSQNLEDRDQTVGMLTDMMTISQDYNGVGVFLAVDEEGGRVARCADSLGTAKLSPMADYGARNDREEAVTVGRTLGTDLRALGFNVDFAPVADVYIDPGNELQDRIFSSDPQVVANMVSGVVEGLQATGTVATLKHFPGLGAENGNAHDDERIVIDRTLDDLRGTEFIPFQAGIDAGADMVMVSHQVVTGVGDERPACLSGTVCTTLLREELGFDGIIVTDAMNMNAVSASYTSSEAAVAAVEAGVDIILMPDNFGEALLGLENAVRDGDISEDRINESVRRILEQKQEMGLLQ